LKFVDEISITIASGHGGPGSVSFRREAMEPRGGPDGGDGGRGGDVIIQASHQLNTLVDYKKNKKYLAENGHPGEGSKCSGADGKDLILKVPFGTIVRTQEGQVLADLTEVHEVVLLKGGRGGKGNFFFRTSVNQAPEHAQPGEPGHDLEIILELKLIADVGIIGFPNAGKSTLISRISAAKPKIADYPFTTLTPNLGVVRVDEDRSYVVADIPGLIKGAHEGHGLGIQFLKHIERTRLFVHLVDGSGFSGRDPLQDYLDIQNELIKYDEIKKENHDSLPLSERPQILVVSKTDALSEDQIDDILKKLKKETGKLALPISSVTGKNIKELLTQMSKMVFETGVPQ